MTSLAVKSFLAFSTSALILETVPATQVPALDGVGRFSLDSALILAVGILWRAYAAKDKQFLELMSKKDDQVVDLATKATGAMTLVTSAVDRNTLAVTELRASVDEVKNLNRSAVPRRA